jgi:hypothetical protein
MPIGQLSALQNLSLCNCSSLQELPTSIGQLSAFQKLDLSKCSSLQELPTSIGQLSALQTLDFIQGQDFNNLRWLCLKKWMNQKLPNNLVNCCHWQIHLTNYNCLQITFDIFNHGLNISICVDMKELSTSFNWMHY